MTVVFYLSVVVAIITALLVVTRQNVVHALLYLVVTLLSIALAFFALGAPFAAALEVIIYAGAIMVLFIFAIMTLGVRPRAGASDSVGLIVEAWLGPALLSLLLLGELVYVLAASPAGVTGRLLPDPKQVGIALLGPYLLAVELASMLLTAGLVGAYHLGHTRSSETLPQGRDRPATPQVGETEAGPAMHSGGTT
jgi:NADH-quinone oxidoreductase subunit J